MSLETFLADLDDLNDEEGGNEDDEQLEEEEEEMDDDDDLDMLAEDDGEPHAASGLLKSARMGDLMESIESAMAAEDANDTESADYDLIVRCNEMVIDSDNEIEAIAKTIRDACAARGSNPCAAHGVGAGERVGARTSSAPVAAAEPDGTRVLAAQVCQAFPRAGFAHSQPARLRAGGAQARERDRADRG